MTTLSQSKRELEKREIFFPIIFENSKNPKDIEIEESNYNIKRCYHKIINIENEDFNSIIFYAEPKIVKDEKNENIVIYFNLKEKKYKIIMQTKGKISFLFNITLEKDKFLSYFRNKEVKQNIISYKTKFICFYEALKKEKKSNEKYIGSLLEEGINSFEGDKSIDYFILLFSNCYKQNSKLLYKLFLQFSKEFNYNKNDNILIDLKDDVEYIFSHKNEIFELLETEQEKEKEKSNIKEKKAKKEKKPKKELKDNIQNIFYFTIIYYYLLINNIEKVSELIEELHKNNKQILFEILNNYSSTLHNYNIINKDLMSEILSDKIITEFNNIKNILSYQRELLIILELIYDKREIIKKLSEKDPKNNYINIHNFMNKYKNDDISKMCKIIDSLIEYQKTKGIFFIEFSPDFWEYYSSHLKEYDMENINKLIELRKTLQKYNSLVNSRIPKVNIQFSDYYSKDQYGKSIHNKIQSNIKNNDYKNLELLSLLFEKDPYYTDESRKAERDINVLNNLDYKIIKKNEEDSEFYFKFIELRLDKIFEEKIKDFFNFFFKPINDILDFGFLFRLFDIEKLTNKALNEYIKNLEEKFFNIPINLKDRNNYTEFNTIVINLIDIMIKKKPDKVIKFLNNLENRCGDNIFEIYTSLLDINDNISDSNIIDHIFSKIKDSEKCIDNSIKLLTKIQNKEIKKRFFDSLKGIVIQISDFFSGKNDKQLNLFISLDKKDLLDKKTDYYQKNKKVLDELAKKLIDFDIIKSDIECFLKLEEEKINEKLKLINGNSEEFLNKLKSKLKEINEEIGIIKKKKDILSIYHKIYLKNDIELEKLSSSFEDKSLKEIEINISKINKILKDKENIIGKVILVKDSILFNQIYNKEKNKGEINEDNLFNNSIIKLNNKKDIIETPEKIDNKFMTEFISLFENHVQLKDEIIRLSKYFKKENVDYELIIDKIVIIQNKDKYIKEIENIIYFLDKIKVKKTKFMDKLKDIIKKLESTNKYNEIKEQLEYLKSNNIFNYRENNKHLDIYRYLYNNELAIDYLLEKDEDSAKNLQEKLDPMETRLTNEDIMFFVGCIKFIKSLNIESSFDKEIFDKIKIKIEKDKSILNDFEKYSNNYKSIKEFDQNFDEQDSIAKKIESNINTGVYYFYKNNDEYKNNGQIIKEGYNYLYDLKCNIKYKANILDEKEEDQNENKKKLIEKLKEKNSIFEYFENIFEKIETIKYYVKSLRNKGSQIDLFIAVYFCFDEDRENGKFYLEKDEKSFEEIKKYLIDVNNYYSNLLSDYYKENEYIRFTYGKQFNFIVDYLSANNNDNSFANYFLNKTPRKELNSSFTVETINTIKNYQNYLQVTLKNISKYIESYFVDNYKNLENFYKEYEVKNKKKGLYYFNSKSYSIEQKTIDLFVGLTGKYPISQNVLLINKTTSLEEIESFLYRSFLCNYNSLFIIGLNNFFPSQSDYLMKITKYLINYIKERDNPGLTRQRGLKANIKPFIIFIYNKVQSKNKFLEHIKKIAQRLVLPEDSNKRNETNKINQIQFERQNSNVNSLGSRTGITNFISPQKDIDKKKEEEAKDKKVFIYKSDINGTGKTCKIKNAIKKENYKYFPFGGFLDKNKVYNKIKDLLDEIKKENKDLNDICIHLDLYETEQQDIMNDFLFSFLYTKYYKNDEKIIYIPREISIYVEIPNCFSNFIETYPLLKIFKTNEVNSEEPPELELTKEEKKIFINLNIKNVNNFINKNIGIENHSYYQKRQFINAFLSQIKDINDEEIIQKFKKYQKTIIESTKHFTKNPYSNLLKERPKDDNKIENKSKKNYLTEDEILNKLSLTVDIASIKKEKEKLDKIPLVFYDSSKKDFFEVSMSDEYYKNKNYDRKKYLSDLKRIFNLENPVTNEEKENNSNLKSLDDIIGKKYVITVDNFRKMVKIYYRIISDINLIIMGETGCGKTLLITKIYELLNNGETIKEENKIIIHGGFTDENIIEKIEKINNNINKNPNQNKKIWVFIDEINTCKSMGLFNEIICNHSCNGKQLNKNLVFIGACNPYRKSNNNKLNINGLIHNSKKENYILYNVNPLSHSLMNFVYYFGSLEKEDEKDYMEAIIGDIFGENEKELKERTTEMLFEAHCYIKENGDVSSVSLREINRFKKCFDFFKQYYQNKKEVLEDKQIKEEGLDNDEIIKKKSIILSIYTCYYLKISEEKIRAEFDNKIKKTENDKKVIGLLESNNKEKKTYYSDILKFEEKFIISQVDLENGIAENRPLRDNIFLLFVAINLNIPIFIIGKPGTSKTLSVNLIEKEMYGKYSKKNFFKKYPALYRTWFQGSENTSPEEVEKLFETAEKKADKNTDYYGQHPISLIFFDEIGLCEISEKKPLKILNFKFEYECKKEYLSFVGISNWILDASKMNRGFTLSVPELHQSLDDIQETCEKIVKSINPKLWRQPYQSIFEALYLSYKEYKEELEKKYQVNEAENPLCHGSRDFYYLIKNVAYNLNKLLESNKDYSIDDEICIVTSAIERNFDSLHLKEKQKIKEGKTFNKSEESVTIFKKIYKKNRSEADKEKLEQFVNKKKEVIKNILSNINDKNSRNLLLVTKSSLNILLVETMIKKLKENNNNAVPIHEIGSPYEEDRGEEYKLKIINQIQKHAKRGDIIILQKFSTILSSLYELFNLNYIKKDGKNYARISVGKSREQFIEVHDNFKAILLYDKEDVKNILQPIASRFEKIEVNFSNLLTDDEIKSAYSIEANINKLTKIKLDGKKCLNYELNNLIVNLDLEEIQSMIYYCRENNIKDKKKYIYEKITRTLPQDIIGGLVFDLIDKNNDEELKEIETIYNNIEKYNNIKEFLDNCLKEKNKFYIIYTFSDLSGGQFDNIENFSKKIDIEMESLIKSESSLEIILKNFYSNKEQEIKVFKIQANSVENIIYLKTFIKSFEKNLKYSINYSEDYIQKKKYIFTVHILRKFVEKEKITKSKNIKNKVNFNTISFTSDDVCHLYIDNLNGNDISLKRIKDSNVNEFITQKLELNKELCSISLDFFNNKIKEINSSTKGVNSKNFLEKMEKYLRKNDENKNEKIQKINDIIIKKINVSNVLKQMFEENYVKNNSIDIVSTLTKYMLHIYKKEALKILDILERNNFLTTIMIINTEDLSSKLDDYFYNDKLSETIGSEKDEEKDDEKEEEKDEDENEEDEEERKNNPDKIYIDNKIVKNVSNKYLELLEQQTQFPTDNKNNNKLCLLYKIPGIYNLYEEIYIYIMNIKSDFFQNEKEFRTALPKKEEIDKLKDNFHDKEETFLDNFYNDFYSKDLFNILIKEQSQYSENKKDENSQEESDNEKEEEKQLDISDNEKEKVNSEDNQKNDFKQFMDLLLKDYITFYLLQKNQEKNKNKYNYQEIFENYNPYDVEHDLILLLLSKRFKESLNIIKHNKKNDLKLFFLKILWIEANSDYIINIIKVYNILSYAAFGEKKYLFKEISDYIGKGNVNYISQEKRNPPHTEEVNECFYILMASICQCITNENILSKLVSHDDMTNYIDICKKALQIIIRLSEDLLLYLNEKYIIEEFLLIINIANKYSIDINFEKNIIRKLKDLSSIMQTKTENKITKLNLSFIDLNKYIIKNLNRNYESKENKNNEKDSNDENEEKDNIDKNDDEYYKLLASFYLNEIKRLSDLSYKTNILEQIFINDKVIKKSLESFKILLKSILQPETDKFENILSNLTTKSDIIFQMIEKKDSIVLDETLFYLFEKNSFIYFEKAKFIVDKIKMKRKFKNFFDNKNPIYIILDEPLNIFEECIKYLENILIKDDAKTKNKKMKKLFCLAYIRVYIYNYIHILKENPTKIDDNKIIKIINGDKTTKFRFIIKLYLYKVIYNLFGRDINKMKNKKIMGDFHLKNYIGYEEFIEKNNEEIFLSQLLLPSEDSDFNKCENLFYKIKSYEKDKFNNIEIKEIKTYIKENDEDMLFSIYANLLSKYFVETLYNKENSSIQQNFWKNYLDKIYSKDAKKFLKIIFNGEDLKKNFKNIQTNQIQMLLYIMRFCFKTFISPNKSSIYSRILSGDKDCLRNSYFVGNDISENNYYDIFIQLKDHFKKNKQDGAYVCLCKHGFCHIIPNGYPTKEDYRNEKCEFCNESVGFYDKYFWSQPVKREGYVRIFEKKEDIDKEDKQKLKTINYITLDEFYKKKIESNIKREKCGIIEVNEEHFKKTNKMIRKIKGQLTYRLLNFILYSHLFIGNIINSDFKINLPKNMKIIEVLEEDWNLLKSALKGKDLIIFLNLVFKKLTDELIKIEEIENIDNLIEIENNLEYIIECSKNNYNDYKNKYISLNEKLRKVDFHSTMSLLNENFDLSLYNNDLYPFYKYFIYTDYVLEKNIKKQNDGKKYITLNKYIDKKNDNIKKVQKSDALILFNKVNKLLYDSYSNKILRKYAEEKILKDEKVFKENMKLFKTFFANLKDIDENLVLKEEDKLIKFILEKNTDDCKQIIDTYENFIMYQNESIKDIFKIKHEINGLPLSEEINIQSVRLEEIFTFKLKKTCLTEIIFENSFRDINFKNIEINYDDIEDILTKKLLGKVKMFNHKINYAVYLNEEYLNENTSLFSEFIQNYGPLQEISKEEKKQIQKCLEKFENKQQCLRLIKDFKEIILNLNLSIIKAQNDEEKGLQINKEIINEKNISSQKKNETEENNGNKESNEDDPENEEKEEDEEKEEKGEQNKEEEKNEKEKKDIKIELVEDEEIGKKEENDKSKENTENKEKKRIMKEKRTKIIDIIRNKSHSKIGNDNYSNEFNILIGKNENFTVDKLVSIFYFAEKLMFLLVIEKEYKTLLTPSNNPKNDKSNEQANEFLLTEENKKQLDEFYKDEGLLITKEVLCNAIRRYLTRYLIQEKDKEKNVKNNVRNFIKYFSIEDLWEPEINNKNNENKKNKEIKRIKDMNIEIKQILSLYEYLGGDDYIKEEIRELQEIVETPKQINVQEIDDEKNQNEEKEEDDDKDNKEKVLEEEEEEVDENNEYAINNYNDEDERD